MRIEGKNAVSEAINSDKTIDRLVIARGLADPASNRIINAAKERGIKIFFKDKEILDKESKTGKHQGFIADITDFEYCGLEDVLNCAKSRGEEPLIIITDGIEDPHNLGSIIRVSECGGAHGIIIPAHRSVSVNDTVVRVSAGAAAHTLIAKVTNINDTIRELKKMGVHVVAAETGGKDLYGVDMRRATAIVVGGEDTGVKRLTKELCDTVATIPMFGKVNSLNASVACGVLLYEAVRQRR